MSRIALLLLLALAGSASASHTLCDFKGADESTSYAFQLIGHSTVNIIQVDAPRSMRVAEIKVFEFDDYARRVDIVHISSGQEGVLPDFVLQGAADEVTLFIDNRAIKGAIRCEWQNDFE